MATSSDRVKIWHVPEDKPVQLLMDLAQPSMGTGKSNPYDAPVTSFDWSQNQSNILATAQMNGIGCVWDLLTMQSQLLIAHEG